MYDSGHAIIISSSLTNTNKKVLSAKAERTEFLERETGFEPATSTLARLHSTAELLPHIWRRLPDLNWR